MIFMELITFLRLVKAKKQTIISITAIFFALTLVITFIQPLKYGSESQILVVQNYAPGTDPYVAAKSNDYLSNILAQVVTSNSFFEEVLNLGLNIDKNYFPTQPDKRLKTWSKTISAKALNDTGIISINVYHTDKYQTEQIARAVNYVIKTKNSMYHGGGNKVNVMTINEPIVSNWPIKPNIILNTLLGIILGLITSLYYIYLFPESQYNFSLMPKKKIKLATANFKPKADVYSAIDQIEKSPSQSYGDQKERLAERNSNYGNTNTQNHNEIVRRGNMDNLIR
jgi:capsular polysaccharide biosynthesis protein